MESISSNKEKMTKIYMYSFVGVMVVLMAAIAIRGKMFVLWYNSVLFVSATLVVATIGFWIYAAIKGFDNVLMNEKRSVGDPLEEILEDIKKSE